METIDELRSHDLRISQPRHGYRFSLDPLLLCDFVKTGGEERIIDLGTGCGVIPLILARTASAAEVVGIEHQEEMAELARRNVSRNELSPRITILHEDVVRIRDRFPVSSFDLVTANPPYRRLGTGKISPKAGRDLARHESTATLVDFLAAAKYLVKPSGSICLIYHPTRLAELCAEAALLKLSPVRLRMVHGNAGAEAGMFLVELVKGRQGTLRVLPPLLVHDDAGNYTDEMIRINGGSGGESRDG